MARQYDTLIVNGMVVDGTRMPRRKCDVAIKDGKIARLGRIDPDLADQIIDAEGQIVAPGFVDLHTHYDAQVFWDPYCSMSGWHGVTSVVIGNCGFGFAPVQEAFRERAMLSMTRVEAIPYNALKAGLPWDWISFPEFLQSLDNLPKAVNLRAFLPVGPLLCWVMGFERAKAGEMPTDTEHQEMRRILHEAMDAGAGGWSAQRLQPGSGTSVQNDYDGTPMPTDVMHDATCLQLAEVLAERNDGFIQVTLTKNDGTTKEHVEELAAVSGRPVLYNVILPFSHRPDSHKNGLQWLKDCRERGLPVYGQGLTTDAGFTFSFDEWNLFDEVPEWRTVTMGTPAERLDKIRDPIHRAALRKAQRPHLTLASIESISVAEVFIESSQHYVGQCIGDIAEAEGKHPIDALLDIAVADELQAVFYGVATQTTGDGFRDLMLDPWIIPGVSDGGAHTRFLTAGRYTTDAIIRAARDTEILSLEDVHWKLSALPAHCAGFTDRGTLQPGKAADIVIYNLEQLEILPVEKTFDFPADEWRRVQKAKGYKYVLVNGKVTIKDDNQTQVFSGELLRNPVQT